MDILLARCLRCPASHALIRSVGVEDQTFNLLTHASAVHDHQIGQAGWTEGEDYQLLGQTQKASLADVQANLKRALWLALNPHTQDDPEGAILQTLVSCFTSGQVLDIMLATTPEEAAA